MVASMSALPLDGRVADQSSVVPPREGGRARHPPSAEAYGGGRSRYGDSAGRGEGAQPITRLLVPGVSCSWEALSPGTPRIAQLSP
jgi:hypothetical protein